MINLVYCDASETYLSEGMFLAIAERLPSGTPSTAEMNRAVAKGINCGGICDNSLLEFRSQFLARMKKLIAWKIKFFERAVQKCDAEPTPENAV